jgi:hypothetical protein
VVYTDKIHLVADTLEELLAFGRAMGLRPEWIQGYDRERLHVHFDLTSPEALARAKKRGAIVISRKKLLRLSVGMKVDERSARELNELFAPSALPVMDGRTGQTELL